MARTGILGGTFDPVHLGHLIVAEEARLALGLEQVLFMLAAQPWRKAGKAVSAGADRLAMVRLATADNPAFAASEIELQREGPTYTADTLAALRAELGSEAELWFLMGADALLDLPNWKDPEQIIALARLAVVERDGGAGAAVTQVERVLPGIAARIQRVAMPRIDMSSTELRRRLREGRSTRYWLHPAVERYATEHKLYRE